jgi:protein-disulfide isomerase
VPVAPAPPQKPAPRPRKQPGKPPAPAWIIVIAVIAIAGIAVLVTVLSGQDAESTTGASQHPLFGSIAGTPDAELPFQTGQTPDGYYYKGDPEAPVQIIEYADYQCPACANFAGSSVYQTLNTDYIAAGEVQYIFHDFPLQIHPNAGTASEAAYCAGEQGYYWSMHDGIFATQATWANLSRNGAINHFGDIVEDTGADRAAFDTCMQEGTYTDHVQSAYQSSIQAGVSATPTFAVDGVQVSALQLMPTVNAALAAEGGS